MSPYTTLGLILTLGSLAAGYLLLRGASDLAALRWWRRGLAACLAGRADESFWMAAGPWVAAVAGAFGVVLPAFLLFEPIATRETPGWLLRAAAVYGAWLIAQSAWRATRATTRSFRAVAAWRRRSERIAVAGAAPRAFAVEAAAPIVAVGGLFRPNLYIDRRVLEACTAGELASIVAHERAHVRRRDNLKRLAFAACPAAGTPRCHSRLARWIAAAERAADEQAVQAAASPLDLASALVKVARLACAAGASPDHQVSRPPDQQGALLAISTVYTPGTLDERVRHLLDLAAHAGRSAPRAPRLSSRALLAAALAFPLLLRGAYAVLEAAVRYLP